MSTAMTLLESGNSRLASHGSFRTPHTALRHAASAALAPNPRVGACIGYSKGRGIWQRFCFWCLAVFGSVGLRPRICRGEGLNQTLGADCFILRLADELLVLLRLLLLIQRRRCYLLHEPSLPHSEPQHGLPCIQRRCCLPLFSKQPLQKFVHSLQNSYGTL